MLESNKRRIYTKEFKQDALNLSQEPGYTIAIAAKNLGIPEGLLYKWRRALEESGPLTFPGHGKVALSDSKKQIRELEKRLRDAEMERDILKKAVGIFSKIPK
jgi:transposase-like protein